MATRKPPTPKQLQQQVDAWQHPAETAVRYWTGTRDGEGRTGVTSTQACILGGHTAGVYIEGAGFVALTHVELALAAVKVDGRKSPLRWRVSTETSLREPRARGADLVKGGKVLASVRYSQTTVPSMAGWYFYGCEYNSLDKGPMDTEDEARTAALAHVRKWLSGQVAS